MNFFSWMFSFLGKYNELEESYENTRYPFFRFLLMAVTAAAPNLLFWGVSAIEVTSGGVMLGLILLFVIAVMLYLKTPKDLFLLALVAINHGLWILVTRKSQKAHNEEITDNVDTKQKKKKVVKWKNINSSPIWDFLIGVLGIALSIGSIVAPFILWLQ